MAVIAFMAATYFLLGRFWLQVALSSLFAIPWTAQFVTLGFAAIRHREPPPYVSKLTFSLWAAAAYPFIFLSAPPGLFPQWFIVISAPVAFLLWYPMISLFLWGLRVMPRWR